MNIDLFNDIQNTATATFVENLDIEFAFQDKQYTNIEVVK